MFKNHLDMIGRNEPIQRKAKFWQSYVRSLKGKASFPLAAQPGHSQALVWLAEAADRCSGAGTMLERKDRLGARAPANGGIGNTLRAAAQRRGGGLPARRSRSSSTTGTAARPHY